MPIFDTSPEKVANQKVYPAEWKGFGGGLNTFLRESEIGRDEMTVAKNLMLVGSGIPTKRWGSADYFLTNANATGYVRGISGFYQADGTNELIALSDSGFAVKKSSASYTMLTGASWASGYDAQLTQLNDNMYFVDGNKELTKYDGSDLSRFTALTQISNLQATNLSGVSGTYTRSWRISAESETGETLASDPVTLANLPQNPSDTVVRLTWTTASPASIVTGFVVYGREPGNETWLDRVESPATLYDDDGTSIPAIIAEPPTADTTGGPIADYLIRYDNRLVVAGVKDNPSRVMFTGRGGNAEKFHWSQGGGYIDIDKNSGDDIMGLALFENSIIVFKQRSVWELQITNIEIGNYTLAYPIAVPITHSHGCISAKTIKAVENDVFYLARDGVYALGYEKNILDVLRTNEVSVKVRDQIQTASYADLQRASATYIDKKYVVSFLSTKKSLMYDRERVAWTGPAVTPYGINNWHTYYDSDGNEVWLAGTDDGFVVDFSDDYSRDRTSAFDTDLKTRKEDYGDWGTFKNIEDLMVFLRRVSGQIDVEILIETRDGSTSVAKNFSITGATANAVWGSSLWADNQWADSEETGSAVDTSDLIKRIIMRKTVRSIQFRLTTSGSSSEYELLGLIVNAKPMGKGALPYSYTV